MNTEFNAAPENLDSQRVTPAAVTTTRLLYWSLRRELWENRSIYVVPVGAAIVFLFGFLVNTITLRRHMGGMWTFKPEEQHRILATPYEMAAALIMGTAFLVGVFYSLDALYGERRDRSILFWKSLPVSDITTVLSKVIVPLFILPLFSFVVTIAAQLMMLLLSSVVLMGSGVSGTTLWTHSSFFHVSVMLLYHLVTVHGLWYAPMYGWLLLVSAWAPRAPFLWAALPPFLICGVEKMAFNTTHFLAILQHRITGPENPAPAGSNLMDAVSALGPLQFFSEPGLWIGLAITAAFLFGAVQLRRYRGPI
jgi:ABC-2 type transport system permease protein